MALLNKKKEVNGFFGAFGSLSFFFFFFSSSALWTSALALMLEVALVMDLNNSGSAPSVPTSLKKLTVALERSVAALDNSNKEATNCN